MGGRVAIVLAFILGSTGSADEIPLNEIWAYDMPGTSGVEKLARQCPKVVGYRNGLELSSRVRTHATE